MLKINLKIERKNVFYHLSIFLVCKKLTPSLVLYFSFLLSFTMKKGIHTEYYKDVKVQCVCGAEFTVNATVPGPIKVETCYQCHPVFNKDRVVKKVVKGRMEKFLEKQSKIDAMKK